MTEASNVNYSDERSSNFYKQLQQRQKQDFGRFAEVQMRTQQSAQGDGTGPNSYNNPQKGKLSHLPAHAIVATAVANGMRLGNSKPSGRKSSAALGDGNDNAATDFVDDLMALTDDTKGNVSPSVSRNDNDSVAFDQAAKLAASGDKQAIMLMAQKRMTEMNQQFNMQFLLIQQLAQKENRQFTTLSNVLKARYEAAKAILKNIT